MALSKLEKIEHLSLGAVFDLTCSQEQPNPTELDSFIRGTQGSCIQRESGKIPGVSNVNNCGRTMPVLKVLQTSHCKFNCKYCSFRQQNDRPREYLTPFEIAQVTAEMTRSGLIEGIFLSSGIGDNVRRTMTDIVDTAHILREKYLYTGYMHLKILPGASIDLIEAAGQYADRLSINMEAPTESTLREIAPNKSIKANILKQMQAIETLRRQGKINRRVGQTTQFVVGSSDDPGANDRALVTAAEYFYRELNFRRIYYSAFNPVPGTPLAGRPPENPRRSHRLYQADRLVALYGFQLDDFIFNDDGKLDLETDPKEAWAKQHPELFPIDITKADPSQLIRIPGIGPITARKICQARADGRLKSPDDFKKIGRIIDKSLDYILINGRTGRLAPVRVAGSKTEQIELPFGYERGKITA
jgi:predicted DNA-binding helix-hairpin-helix protein